MRYESISIGEATRSGRNSTDFGTILPIPMAVSTNGTTAVNVFGTTGCPFPSLTLVGAFVTSKDVTAGNIVIKHAAGTVATIAKGTSIGVAVGPATLANATVTKGGLVTIESSSAGDAFVYLFYA